MRFDDAKKQAIIIYLLEKVEQNAPGISKAVSETFSVNQNTIHTYINELVDANVIRRVKRGQYELITRHCEYTLSREKGELDSDLYAYDHCMAPYLKEFAVNIRDIWSYTFSEMINNVMDHSRSERVRIRIDQDYLKTRASILDDGVGIFKKIKEYFGFATLDEAICELFKGKLTTDSHNHSGEGIFFTSKLMDEFFIVSSGKVFSNNRFDQSDITSFTEAAFSGTGVFMALSNHSQKRPKDVFDLYSNEDGRFSKTRIPLKNMFDSSPVSRSQAKRVCNRLEGFQEVILDFDGIQWMGQGFAHQLFHVFASEHPEIRLNPVNMSEDVRKMYVHVS
ncbi:MAG: DUF4325 domain-containing protein [Lachnospiraceae bacterium]|nr:DUF4325 domain-containing protein [Lachnospiraceae bacterium]